MSADVTAKKLKHILNDKISTSEIDIGALVVPPTVHKTSVKYGDVVTERCKSRAVKLNNRKGTNWKNKI